MDILTQAQQSIASFGEVAHIALAAMSMVALMYAALPGLWRQPSFRTVFSGIGIALATISGSAVIGTYPAKEVGPAMASGMTIVGLLLVALIMAAVFFIIVVIDDDGKDEAEKTAPPASSPFPSPLKIAAEMAPKMLEDVRIAMARIRHLRDLDPQVTRPDDATAIIMIENHLPSVMNLYQSASAAGNDAERAELARTALTSVIEIGEMAEAARERILADRRIDLAKETRYISIRNDSAPTLGL